MKTLGVSNYELSRIQEFTKQSFDELPTKFPLLNGAFVEDVEITSSDTPINHKLSRNITGWAVVRKDAQGDVWESATVNPRPRDQVILKSSATVTVTLYFF